ncbi:MAG: NAD(P)H-dependent oxidoreductase [Bifidobacterium psychraerophilum]|uniref:NAD(P)H-dependent oxidoreductase n=1 Tax=Bifidobacterium psychraerophilum TaxID=218140 RepID=UPI0039EAA184
MAAEQWAREEHDRIVLQFPFHWYSSPPLLKTWLDDVLEHGWAYGPDGTALQGKELALAVSTWSTAADYTATGRYGRTMSELTSPYEITALRTGMHYRPGFFLNGISHVTDQELTQNAIDYARWLNEK